MLTVRAGPAELGSQPFGLQLILSHFIFIHDEQLLSGVDSVVFFIVVLLFFTLFFVVFFMVRHDLLVFLLLSISNCLLKRGVEFLDPTLDAAQMEGLVALFAVPDGTSGIDDVCTDSALLSTITH